MTPQKTRKVKVGDKLRVDIPRLQSASVKRGDILEVTSTISKWDEFEVVDARGYTWYFALEDIHNGLEFVDLDKPLFKVGDKGKTRGGDDYEVTAVGAQMLLCTCRMEEGMRYQNGNYYRGKESELDLLPPKRRIKGYCVVGEKGGASRMHRPIYTKAELTRMLAHGTKALAIFEIDAEEGEGL